MANHQAHVAVASVNQTVGDWQGNERRVREVIDAARAEGVKLLLLPEMCLSGYSLGDRLLRVGTAERSWERLMNLVDATHGLAVGVGLPILFEGVLFNVMGLLADGRLVGLVAKENLATGDVEYENRYFSPWPHGRLVIYRGPDGTAAPLGTQVFELPGLGTVAFEICEDAWKGIRPGSFYALTGAEILMNPSASWFVIGKHQARRRMVRQISREDHCAYLYTSLLGCDSTRLIFDGSLFVAVNGRIEAEGRRFVFDRDWELLHRVIDLGEIRHVRMEEGSWRDQLGRVNAGLIGKAPSVTTVPGDFSTTKAAPPPPPYWIPPEPVHPDPSLQYLEITPFQGRSITERDLNHLELELALVARPARLHPQVRHQVLLPCPLRRSRQLDGGASGPPDVPIRLSRPVPRRPPPQSPRRPRLRLPRHRELRPRDPFRRPRRGRGNRRHLLRRPDPAGPR